LRSAIPPVVSFRMVPRCEPNRIPLFLNENREAGTDGLDEARSDEVQVAGGEVELEPVVDQNDGVAKLLSAIDEADQKYSQEEREEQ